MLYTFMGKGIAVYLVSLTVSNLVKKMIHIPALIYKRQELYKGSHQN